MDRVIGRLEDGVIYELLDEPKTTEQLYREMADQSVRHFDQLERTVDRWRAKGVVLLGFGIVMGATLARPTLWAH